MAKYYGAEAYDFSLFENDLASLQENGNAAPVLPEPEYPEEPQPERVHRPSPRKKTAVQPKAGELKPTVKATVAILMTAVIVTCCGLLLGRRAQIDDYATKINALNKQIKMEQSDNVRLHNDINLLFSKKEVEFYAENILGMVKLDNYNTIQITLPKSDRVVISGGKTVPDSVAAVTSPLVLRDDFLPVPETAAQTDPIAGDADQAPSPDDDPEDADNDYGDDDTDTHSAEG